LDEDMMGKQQQPEQKNNMETTPQTGSGESAAQNITPSERVWEVHLPGKKSPIQAGDQTHGPKPPIISQTKSQPEETSDRHHTTTPQR
jgi:hypothetical protein